MSIFGIQGQHERLCKYFSPGLLDALRNTTGLGSDTLPFWAVFVGDITRDPCRVREVTLWFRGYDNHFFMWRDEPNTASIVAHFQKKLRHLLE
jgi:hypothetical protein